MPRLLVVGCWLLVVGCWLLVVGCWLLVVGCWLLVAGCWLLVVGCWLLVVGCWLLVAGCWPFTVGREFFWRRWRKRHSFVRASYVFCNFAKRSQDTARMARSGTRFEPSSD